MGDKLKTEALLVQQQSTVCSMFIVYIFKGNLYLISSLKIRPLPSQANHMKFHVSSSRKRMVDGDMFLRL